MCQRRCLGSSGAQPQPAAPPAAAQDVSVNSSNTQTAGVSTPVSSSAVIIQTGTIRPASSAPGVTARYVGSLYYDVDLVNECLDLVVLLWPQCLQVEPRAFLVQYPRLALPLPAPQVPSLV